MKKKGKKAQTGPKFIPCGHCMGGLVRVQRGDGYVMRDCECMLAWKGLKDKEDVVCRKSRAAND